MELIKINECMILLVLSQILLSVYLYLKFEGKLGNFYNVINTTKLINNTSVIYEDIFVVEYNSAMMTNETLFKHEHENDGIKFCNDFTVIYLTEGNSIFELNDWYKLMYENDNNYMIFLYYNETSYNNDYNKLLLLLNRTNQYNMKLVIIGGFNTSLTEGRNILLSYFFKYENIMLQGLGKNCNFNYVCLLDEDVVLFGFDETNNNIIKLNNNSDYNLVLNDFYFNFLQKYNPFVGIPHRIDKNAIYSYRSIPTKYLGSKYLFVQAWDEFIAYYFRPLLNNFFIFPYYASYDYRCWWWSGRIQRFKLRMLFPPEKYKISIMYMKTAVMNIGHTTYPTLCDNGPDMWYTLFAQYVAKYLNIDTSTTLKCNKNTWSSNLIECNGSLYKHFQVRSKWLQQISLQKYNYTKNNPKHYLDEFDLCNAR